MKSNHKLAVDFAESVREYLTLAQLAEVVMRNAHEADSTICHSHDFIDPNQCMLDALEEQGMEFEADNMGQSILIDDAWNMAKACAFDAARLSALCVQLEALDQFELTGDISLQEVAAYAQEFSGVTVGPQGELIQFNKE